MRIDRLSSVILLGGPLLFLGIFFLVPFGQLLMESLQRGEAYTISNYTKILTDGFYWKTILFTFEISLWSTLLCFVLGYPVAYYLNFYVHSRQARRLIYLILITPLFTSNIVRAFGWIVMLGREGIVNKSLLAVGLTDAPLHMTYTKWGIVLALSYTLVPFMVLAIGSVLQNINRSVIEAARDLGANPVTTFLKVTLPLSLPGVMAGTLIVFTLGVSAYVTPSMMSGGRFIVMPMVIFQQYMVVFDANVGAALSVILLFMTLLLIIAYSLLLNRSVSDRAA
jgi:putative spermidine/putrescine transport system permease protein